MILFVSLILETLGTVCTILNLYYVKDPIGAFNKCCARNICRPSYPGIELAYKMDGLDANRTFLGVKNAVLVSNVGCAASKGLSTARAFAYVPFRVLSQKKSMRCFKTGTS